MSLSIPTVKVFKYQKISPRKSKSFTTNVREKILEFKIDRRISNSILLYNFKCTFKEETCFSLTILFLVSPHYAMLIVM